MKKVYFILAIVLAGHIAKANIPDSIPNSGFEQWYFSQWYAFPADWMTNNSQLLAPVVVQDTDAHSGFTAMMLYYQGGFQPHAWCDFPLTSHPSNFGGYIKNHLLPNDSVVIVVYIYLNQQIVDSGYAVMYGGINPAYTAFVVPISQNSLIADSCEISFTGGMDFNSSVSFDDLQFDLTLGIPPINKSKFSAFPNPCHEYVTLKFYQDNFKHDDVEAYNMLGQRKEISMDVENNATEDYIVDPAINKIRLNTSSLQTGVWIIIIRNEKQMQSILLVKD